MGILDEFNPRRDGWFFENWGEASEFDWDLFRRTYLAINPTNDPVAAPLDVAFFQIFKSCAANGNCGGMSMLALALFKYGGYLGYGSPANFYTGAGSGPDRADLHQAINIMQARQFSAAGIRNFLDVVKAGQLNDGFAAYDRIVSGLGSGDYCMLSLSNGVFGDAAHTIIPYRAEMIGGTRVLHVWDPNRPYDAFSQHYDADHNKITITGPTSWSYDQNAGGLFSGGTLYAGSNNGWFFAIPTSLEVHKGRQPISAGFILTGLTTLFVSGVGAAVTQIEDDEGRRLYSSDRVHRNRGDLETLSDRRLTGVAPWPWPGGLSGELPGELFFIERPPGSSPLHVTVRGDDYHLMHLSESHLTELSAARTGTMAKDSIRLTGSADDAQSLAVSTRAARRRFDIHHLRHDGPEAWRSVRVRNATVTRDRLTVSTPVTLDEVEISGTTARRDVDVELRRFVDGKVSTRRTPGQRLAAGRVTRLAPSSWDKLSRARVEQVVD
ncbi:MAG: hypothetical protein U0R80_00615 [Nocardioidaceae bacterium]